MHRRVHDAGLGGPPLPFDVEGALFAAFPPGVWLDGTAERAVRAEARRLFGGAALTPFRASVAFSAVHGALVAAMDAETRRRWCCAAWRERAGRLVAHGVRPAPIPLAYRRPKAAAQGMGRTRTERLTNRK